MAEPNATLKRAVRALVKSSRTAPISRVITPEGDVIVVARSSKHAADAKTSAEVLAKQDCDAKDGQHDYAACLYAWYEDHKVGG